jgi:hypothetical protein
MVYKEENSLRLEASEEYVYLNLLEDNVDILEAKVTHGTYREIYSAPDGIVTVQPTWNSNCRTPSVKNISFIILSCYSPCILLQTFQRNDCNIHQ